MVKRVVILGKCAPHEDAKALKAMMRFVSDTEPNEVVCTEATLSLLEGLRKVYDGPIGVHASSIEAGFEITALPNYYRIAPGWITTHGHCGGTTLSPIAGNTALRAARKLGVSVVMGHTHKAGILSHSEGYGGEIKRQLTGVEVGHLMDQRKAHYLKGGTRNWQLGFGLLTIENRHVQPEVIPIIGGRFTVDGETWEV